MNRKGKLGIAAGAIIITAGIGSAIGGHSSATAAPPSHPVASISTPAAPPNAGTNPDAGQTNNAPPAPPQPTVAQQQALDSAQSYLDMGGFSRYGLIDQLTSKAGEGFHRADAVWAIRHLHPDWNQQAVESAKSYLKMGGFSRSSLIEQLTSHAGEGFTLAQATYAADQVGL